MKNCVLLMTFQAFVMNSVVFGYHGNKGCTRFIDDTSSLEDDSDYQLDGSGSVISHYDVGDDLGLAVHVENDWELKVSWNVSKYHSQAPAGGWYYKVQFSVNTTYNTSFGMKSFISDSEHETHKNHIALPLYNPSAKYTVTLLTATRTQQCLGERIVLSDLPAGREDAIAHFQMRLKFYTYWGCKRKLRNQDKVISVLSGFRQKIFDSLSNERFRDHSLNMSHYQLTDLNVTCQDRPSHNVAEFPSVAMFTGRIVAIGNTTTTQFISALQAWVRTQPTLPIRYDSVVVDADCGVRYVPGTEFCTKPDELDKLLYYTNSTFVVCKSGGLHGAAIVGIILGGILLLVLVAAVVFGVYRKKILKRFGYLSFRSRTNMSRRLRINNVLADVENTNRPANYATNKLNLYSSRQNSNGR